MTRARKSIAWVCLALIVFATIVPAVADHFALVLPAVWLLFVPILLVVIGRERAAALEQIASLQSSIPPRAPPAACSLI